MTWEYKLYDIYLNEYYYYENINFVCVTFMDSICSPNWRSSKKDFKVIAHNINEFYNTAKYYLISDFNYSNHNRYIVFDKFNRIIHKHTIYDKMISMSQSEIKRTRKEFRKNRKSIQKSIVSLERWKFKCRLRIRTKYYYNYYRNIRTTQERRQSCTEYSFLVRDSRKLNTLPNVYDDIQMSRNGFGWKNETKFKKQWMKNIWK